MGHIRLGILPRTKRWEQVIALLEIGSDATTIGHASFQAVQNGLSRLASDPGFVQVLTTVFEFMEAAGSREASRRFWEKGFSLPNNPSFFDFMSSFKEKTDFDLNHFHSKSDASEIAQNAFTEALGKSLANEMDTLFGVSPETTRRALAGISSGHRFQSLMHEFFASFANRYLSYYLSRELSNHVGQGLRFDSIKRHQEFTKAFDTYIRETIRITDEFTPGWFGKARFEKRLQTEEVSKFAYVAIKKIKQEFIRGYGGKE